MSRQKKLDKMDVIELAAEKPKPEFNFKTARTPGRYIFQTNGLVIGYDDPLSSALDLEMERGQKIVLTGANGIGKTTLLKSILGLIKPLSGSVTLGDYMEIGYFEQEMDQSVTTTCIEEIWNEFPAFSQYWVFLNSEYCCTKVAWKRGSSNFSAKSAVSSGKPRNGS